MSVFRPCVFRYFQKEDTKASRTDRKGMVICRIQHLCELQRRGILSCQQCCALLIGTVIGITFCAFGVIKIIGYLSRDLFRLAFQYDLAFGILVLTLGVISMVHPVNTWSYTCIAFGICVLADSLFKIQISLDARVFGIRSWWMILVLAAVAGTFGVLLVFRPSTSSNMMAILIGVSLLADGIMNLATVLSSVKIISHQVSDRAIEADYYEE